MLRKLAVTAGLLTILAVAAAFAPHEHRQIHATETLSSAGVAL